MARVAVALSGGGHRAALFDLGVLLYLVDAGKGREGTSIASVSGGSLTNGAVAQSVDLQTVDAATFRTSLTPAARRFATKGTVWPPSLLTAAYLLLLNVVALGTAVCEAGEPGSSVSRLVAKESLGRVELAAPRSRSPRW